MGQRLPADILNVGMVTPVGLSARASAAAIRAGISRVKGASPRDKHFQPQVMGVVGEEYLPSLRPAVLAASTKLPVRHGRMLRLATLALQQALADWRGAPPPLLLALPEVPRSGQDPVDAAFLQLLSTQSDIKLDLQQGRVFRNGRAGGLMVLQHALGLLDRGQAAVVCVGGVDTYMDLRLLAELDAETRLVGKSSGDAFIPGEGAAFLLLAGPGVARSLSRAPIAQLLGAGEGAEKGHLYSKTPHLGDGLADAFRTLFSSLPAGTPRVSHVYAGLNGEHLWAKDWGVAYLRNAARFEPHFQIEHPVEFMGDPGAALGPIMVGVAAIGLQRGYRQGPCLVWCASDREERAAALVHASRAQGG
jgi:3-oxoacyl-[acyl-carrier-protein] synthase-1